MATVMVIEKEIRFSNQEKIEAIVINIFERSVAMLPWNKALWLIKRSHMEQSIREFFSD